MGRAVQAQVQTSHQTSPKRDKEAEENVVLDQSSIPSTFLPKLGNQSTFEINESPSKLLDSPIKPVAPRDIGFAVVKSRKNSLEIQERFQN